MRFFTLILSFLITGSIYADYIRMSGGAFIMSTESSSIPNTFRKDGQLITNYKKATHRHFADGWREIVNFEVPEGHIILEGTRTLTYDPNTQKVIESYTTQTEEEFEAERHASKSEILKACENSMIDLLKILSIIPQEATTTQGLNREDIELQLILIGQSDRSVETGNVLSRLKDVLDLIEKHDGNPEDAIIHE
jgi:hypothetical protein